MVVIDKHLEQQLINLRIPHDEWTALVNSALSEKLKKEVRWAADKDGYYRAEENEINNDSVVDDCESIIVQLNAIKTQLQANYKLNLPKKYYCLKCNYFHVLPEEFLSHLKFKGEMPEESKEYYEAVSEERHAHTQLAAHRQLLKRAEKEDVKERINHHKERIEALTPGWKLLNDKVHELRKEIKK